MAYHMMLQDIAVHVETDMFFDHAGEYCFEPALLPAAHKWCQAVVENMMGYGDDIVVSNTFTQLWEMQPYLELAEKFKYDVVVYRCVGDFGSVHNVPESAIARMKDRFEDYPNEILI
jgi:hypothetical protein